MRRRGKKVRKGKKHLKSSKYKFYEINNGKVVRNKKNCPRCGDGVFLAEHKNRFYCGKCGYTEFKN